MNRMKVVGLLMLAALGMASGASAQGVAKGKNEAGTELFINRVMPTEEGADSTSSANFSLGYSRFFTDRLSAGPVIGIAKHDGQDAAGYAGGRVRFHFANLSGRAIPYAEVYSTRSFNEPVADNTDLLLKAGVMIPMGKTGGNIRVAPYYYRVFYNESEVGYSSFQSFGISWSVGLLF